ncbi:TetR/AcrR family transcriptional regulator [Veronia nyctiphanis]|uniref:TetR/AcrR family transcriptional regulator n=1 Tax=Veronia nyctiphanis TaxID=1278244 RepID=UPI001F3DD43F|nr:TetR/AcrR family transcriptional regulator [Veronia nyctiphanis]
MSGSLSATKPSGLTRKQQALLDREQELIAIAFEVVKREGFTGLTMDKVAAASSYSKGTVYNHFTSKEDLIAALATKALSQEIAMFKRASAFKGNNREKLLAVHVAYALFCCLEPALSNCVLSCRTPAVTEKSSEKRLAAMNSLEAELLSLGDQIMELGAARGEVDMSGSIPATSIVFANWAMGFGANALFNSASESGAVVRVQETCENPILDCINLLLDGVGWKPLSTEFNYQETWQRVLDEIFPEEAAFIRQSKSL